MTLRNKKEPLLLLLGDIALFILALWFMLVVRYGTIPTQELFALHLIPFSILFAVWVIVFFIAGLYGKHTLILRRRLEHTILNAQVVNSAIAIAFFYFVPFFGITPKINLFIYLGVSFVFILLWRAYGHMLVGSRKKYRALLIGSGREMRELEHEIAGNPRYNVALVGTVDLERTSSQGPREEVMRAISEKKVSLVVINTRSQSVEPLLPDLYALIFKGVRFLDMHRAYEDIFDRVPLSLLEDSWFLENLSSPSRSMYDRAKRVMDVLIATTLFFITVPFYVLVFLMIKLDDGGELFSIQDRVGEHNITIRLYKFRTMTIANDNGRWGNGNTNRVTRVGGFLRMTRIDEFPQLLNVVTGDISLIGPRPEFPEPVAHYSERIPYYNVRHLIKPGLSGWAQLYGEHPHHGTDVETTKNKLSYDLYYLKNRSLLLDIAIALKTVKTLLSRSGI